MTSPNVTETIIAQGFAIEALSTIQPTGPFERALARLLIAAYKRRLRGIVAAAPTWVRYKDPARRLTTTPGELDQATKLIATTHVQPPMDRPTYK